MFDYGLLIKVLLVLAGVAIAIIKFRSGPSKAVIKKYDSAYKILLDGAFKEDEKSYKKLVIASIYWDRLQFEKAHKILDELLSKCTCTKDYLTVYTIKGICYARADRNEPLVETYKKMLQYDAANAQTWSNLGWAYLKMGNTVDAKEALLKALSYDSENPLAYNNMATFYFKTAEPELALEYAKKTMEMAPELYQPYSAAAIACKMLGDEENAKRYASEYVNKGGDKKKVEQALAFI